MSEFETMSFVNEDTENTDDNDISIAEAMGRVKRRQVSESRGCIRPGGDEDTANEAAEEEQRWKKLHDWLEQVDKWYRMQTA